MRKPELRIRYFWVVVYSVIGFLLGLPVYLYFSPNLAALLVPLVFSGGMFYYSIRRYANWGFELRDDHVYIQHGVLKKVYSMVPYVRVQHVDTQRSVIARLLGLSRVVIYTAGTRGSDVSIIALSPEDAREIQEKLRDVAIESEDRDAV